MPSQEMHTATDEETYELASFIGWIIVNMIFNIAISAIIINEHGNVIENEDKIPLEKEKKMLEEYEKFKEYRKKNPIPENTKQTELLKDADRSQLPASRSTLKDDQQIAEETKKNLTDIFKVAIACIICSVLVIILFVLLKILDHYNITNNAIHYFIYFLLGLFVITSILCSLAIDGSMLFTTWNKYIFPNKNYYGFAWFHAVFSVISILALLGFIRQHKR